MDVPLGKRVMLNCSFSTDSDEDKPPSDSTLSTRTKTRTFAAKVERCLGTIANRGVRISSKRNSDLDMTLGVQQLVSRLQFWS